MPVYNGERFVGQAIESLLAQTLTDFELVICDNASEDRTEALCRQYAARDPRIRYHRNESNFGASRNYNRVFELSRGSYFKWAAHDDVCAPEFLERCVAVLDRDPGIVLCFPRARVVNESGETLLEYTSTLSQTSLPDPATRFANVVRGRARCSEVFGLIRADVLRGTRLIAPFVASDRVLLAELALRGRFHEVPEYLFSNRDHPNRSINRFRERDLGAWFDPALAGRISLPQWRLLREYSDSARRAGIGPRMAIRTHLTLAAWMVDERWPLFRQLAGAVRWRARQVLGTLDAGDGAPPACVARHSASSRDTATNQQL
jgi:glycosyltransferase involved in cell wall biosynthesis